MPTSTSTFIYVGNFGQFDTAEGVGQQATENAAGMISTYTPIDMVDVDLVDNDFDGAVSEDIVHYLDGSIDHASADDFTYDLGGGDITSQLDLVVDITATVTLVGGGTLTMTLSALQTVNGDLFIMPGPGDPNGLDNLNITSIEILSVSNDTYSGINIPTDTILNANIACFCAGTLIETKTGPVPVELLKTGAQILTKDHGVQPLRWVAKRILSVRELEAQPNFWPVRIGKGALGAGLPARDLCVSPQHRMLISSRIAARMFGTAQVLIAAKKLLPLAGIDQPRPISGLHYYHLLFDRHQVIIADGAPTESLYLGDQALDSLSPEGRTEILALFGKTLGKYTASAPARCFAIGKEAKQLVARHAKNQRPLIEPPSPVHAKRATLLPACT